MNQSIETLEGRIQTPEETGRRPFEGVVFELSQHTEAIAEGLLSAAAVSLAYAKGDPELLLAATAGAGILLYSRLTS